MYLFKRPDSLPQPRREAVEDREAQELVCRIQATNANQYNLLNGNRWKQPSTQIRDLYYD